MCNKTSERYHGKRIRKLFFVEAVFTAQVGTAGSGADTLLTVIYLNIQVTVFFEEAIVFRFFKSIYRIRSGGQLHGRFCSHAQAVTVGKENVGICDTVSIAAFLRSDGAFV